MKEVDRSNPSYGQNLSFTVGVVKDNADPAQHGRLKVFIPSMDTEDYDLETLPWCWYVSPFGGTTLNPIVGHEKDKLPGGHSYGMWAIPKNGAQVIVGFLDGNPATRFWMGCLFMPEYNRTLPVGIDGSESEIDESGLGPSQETAPIWKRNLQGAGLWKGAKHWRTRGGYERSVSHPSNKNSSKPIENGYGPNQNESGKAESQMVGITTAGKHYFVMSDVDDECRIRLKTTQGNQVIFDDTNERIYVSTAQGRNWIELDETNGRIYVFSDSKINIRSYNDLNLYSDKNINIVAKHRVNIQSEERAVKIQAYRNIEALSTHANVKISASRDMYLKTFDGPRAPPIDFKEWCVKPPPKGEQDHPLGLNRNFAEEGGSPTSSFFFETVDASHHKVNSGPYYMSAKDEIDIKSNTSRVDVQAVQDINIKTQANINEECGATHNTKAGAAVLETAGVIGHDAGVILGTTYIGIWIGVHIDAPPGAPPPAGSAQDAENADPSKRVPYQHIPPFMIIPDHESWERDEDEPKCRTPRNSLWRP